MCEKKINNKLKQIKNCIGVLSVFVLLMLISVPTKAEAVWDNCKTLKLKSGPYKIEIDMANDGNYDRNFYWGYERGFEGVPRNYLEIQFTDSKGKTFLKKKKSYWEEKALKCKNKKMWQPFAVKVRLLNIKPGGIEADYCDWSSRRVYVPGAHIKSIKRLDSTNIAVSWDKTTGASYYQVWCAKKPTLTKYLSWNDKWYCVAKKIKGNTIYLSKTGASGKMTDVFYIRPMKVKFGGKKYNADKPKYPIDVFEYTVTW